MSDPTAWYDAHADELSDRYETVPAARVHGWLQDLLPATPATVLDVGTGSGRDAAWLSRKGYDVVAAEPSSRFRTIARDGTTIPSIQWLSASLPGVAATEADLESYYSAVNLQRLRLKQNQQVPEWDGQRYP